MSGENKMHRAIDIVCDPALHTNPAIMKAFEKQVRDEHETLLRQLKARSRRYRTDSKLIVVGGRDERGTSI